MLAVRLTPGNVDVRAPVPQLAQCVFGKLIGDKGYISKTLFAKLFERDIQLVTRLKTSMKIVLCPW
ncbi:MAG: hypothetical protein IIB17_09480 [Chloroflexi bacterium]|nr:hypothetical protein [Chloroflexota bacterium]